MNHSCPSRLRTSTLLLLAANVGFFWFADARRAGAHELDPAGQEAFEVPSDEAWVSTRIYLEKGHKLHIDEVKDPEQVLIKGNKDQAVTARGTYLFDAETTAYPLEPDRLHDDTRYPGYSLIGRMGESGTPFFVGTHFQGLAPQAGILFLGINDPAPRGNRGAFRCQIALDYPDPPLPKPTETEAATRAESKKNPEAPEPTPEAVKPPRMPDVVPDANVVIFFVDGLRPDVITEMAEWGHVPNFRELFLDNGTWVRNSFTVQPSLTLISFSSMITGVYANRHGVKMQTYYDRETDAYINGLSTRRFTVFADEVKARGVKAIYDYFPTTFASGAMPYEPFRPDVLQMNLAEWFHRAVNASDYATAIKAKMDESQTRFAIDLASSSKVKVMLIWLPGNDVASEHIPHGQFGGARPTIARMDQDLGQIVERFKNRHRFEKTYFILVSDHGHSGGHEIVNERYDVGRQVFHAQLQMNVMNSWSLRPAGIRKKGDVDAPRPARWHNSTFPGAPPGRIGSVADCDGAAGIFLPVGNEDSGDLSHPNTYEQLANYGIAGGKKTNAVELFAEFTANGRWPLDDVPHRPVDFAVAMVDPDTILIHKTMDRQALIHARRNAEGVFEYKYEPASHYVSGHPVKRIDVGDPLGYLDNAEFRKEVGNVPRWIESYHTGTEWLRATYRSNYPACVDTLCLFFRWDGPVSKESPRPSQPDILLFTNRGWVFEPKINQANQPEGTLGSRHGMAYREATNNCMFVSGPGIKKHTIDETPHRMVDLMPTVLQMMGMDSSKAGMDGHPMLDVWEGFE